MERERDAHKRTREAFNNFIQISVLRCFLETQAEDPRLRLMRLAMKTVDEHFEGFRFANEVELQTALQAIAGATDALHYQVALRKVQSCHELSDTQKLSVLHAIFEVVGIV